MNNLFRFFNIQNLLEMKRLKFSLFVFLMIGMACSHSMKQSVVESEKIERTDSIQLQFAQDTIIDSDYTFSEAIAGSSAPKYIIDKLKLITVHYVSTDGRIHRGQILTNSHIADDLSEMFDFMLYHDFVVEKVIPIVRYNWDDSLSMDDNNSYSFCYRNASYSKHAIGMAIDINPRFNPVRWKIGNLPNEPEGAVMDTTVNGTFFEGHLVVEEFRKRGFRWGHSFSKYYDDHHFEKR
jgi:hypothetical protein